MKQTTPTSKRVPTPTLKQIKPVFNFLNKTSRPILSTIKVDSNSIVGTDFETFIRIKDNYGLTPGHLYHQKTIDIADIGPTKIPTDEYPIFDFTTSSHFQVKNVEIKTIERLLPFTSKDETRLHLNSICVRSDKLIAVDGHKLAQCEISNIANESYLMPSSSLKILVQLCKKFKLTEICINLADDYMQVDNLHFTFKARLINRDFPNTERVIPTKTTNSFTIDRWIDFKEVKRLMGKTKGYKSKLILKDGKVSFAIADTNIDFAPKDIGFCNVNTAEVIGYNAEYLDTVMNKGKDKLVTFGYNNTLSPTTYRADESNITGVIMPVKL